MKNPITKRETRPAEALKRGIGEGKIAETGSRESNNA